MSAPGRALSGEPRRTAPAIKIEIAVRVIAVQAIRVERTATARTYREPIAEIVQRLSFDDRRLVRTAQVGRVISAVPYQSSTQIAQLSTTLEDVQTLELDTRDVIAEALAIIDKNLGVLVQRELVSSSEMTDLLLDVRSLLAERSSN